jgi:hypothetical protein
MSKSLCELINERPHLNKSSVCKLVGIHRGNFDKYLQAGRFPEKIEKALFEELKIYGILEKVPTKRITDESGQNPKLVDGKFPPSNLKGLDIAIWKAENK